MPKLSRDSRVSILIPLQRNEALFEETLLSVLENLPDGCEVVAVHNGTYSDPFDLGDEVHFVTARSSSLVDSIRDGFEATTSPIVHVLGGGFTASSGWLDDPLARLDDVGVAAVAPTLVDSQSGRTIPSGWADLPGRLCQVGESAGTVSGRRNSGFMVNAFFIRRRLLGDLLDAVAPAMNDRVAVSYAFGCLLRRAGWKIELSDQSRVQFKESAEFEDVSGAERGQSLAAIHARVFPKRPLPGYFAMLQSAIIGSSSLGEMIGAIRHRASLPAMRRAIDVDCVANAEDLAKVLSMPAAIDSNRRMAA